jgi:hypothetical protein
MHGGKSPGGRTGAGNGAWKHGGRTMEAIALRRAANALMREIARA